MVKFGIKAGSLLAGLALSTVLFVGCGEESTPAPTPAPTPKAAPGATPPGKGPEAKGAPAPSPTPAAKPEEKK
jgi:hypothetical protein